jgi:hypothetical protein
MVESSLNSIASQILNDTYAGLKAPNTFAVPARQIKDEFGQARNRYIFEQVELNRLDREGYMQNIPKLNLVKKDFVGLGLSTSRKEYWAEIPKSISIVGLDAFSYISTLDGATDFKIVFDDDYKWAAYDKYTGKKPMAWIQGTNLWILNPPVANLSSIKLRYILDNPKSINGVAGIKFMDDDPYPCPGHAIGAIKDKLVNDYLRRYRLANPLPTLIAGDPNMGGGKVEK